MWAYSASEAGTSAPFRRDGAAIERDGRARQREQFDGGSISAARDRARALAPARARELPNALGEEPLAAATRRSPQGLQHFRLRVPRITTELLFLQRAVPRSGLQASLALAWA